MIHLSEEGEKEESDFGHDEGEWGFKDNSEDAEWDRYYTDKSKRWRSGTEPDYE